MSKYVIRLYDAWTHRQLKQKTIRAESWDKAEEVAHDLWEQYEDQTGRDVDMGMSFVPQ